MSRVAIGGTFCPIHDGHRALLARALRLSDGGTLTVGLTSNKMAQNKFHVMEDWEVRKQKLIHFMESTFGVKPHIVRLDDPFGPTLEEDFDYLVVSPETEPIAEKINQKRKERGKEAIEIVRVEYVLAWDGLPISSTRILNGEIDISGNPVQHR